MKRLMAQSSSWCGLVVAIHSSAVQACLIRSTAAFVRKIHKFRNVGTERQGGGGRMSKNTERERFGERI